MSQKLRVLLILGQLFLLLGGGASARVENSPDSESLIRHDLSIVLEPDKHWIEVTDDISLPGAHPADREGKFHFLLHGGLHPASTHSETTITREPVNSKPDLFGKKPGQIIPNEGVPLEHYSVTLPRGQRKFTVRYQGELDHPVREAAGGDARDAGETPGRIAPEGIFLGGASIWYPRFGEAAVRFTMDLRLPEGWEAVSQGKRTRHERADGAALIRWESPEPQDEIYLVGGRWTQYRKTAAGGIELMAFLRTPDEALAARYLDAADPYLAMYGQLFGPYPYPKFALVENFWETGYGMPSFTLLGSSVIRLPFLLQSSYPHEILHNWWGNGVYVDEASGNWSEGLTSYLADHLIQEQQGAGVAYRRGALQKYADYAAEGRDFPLSAFRARHSGATEAVGYGKAMMLFHMLRLAMGDDAFRRALREFYAEHRFRRAGFSDLERSFSRVYRKDLSRYFRQWVEGPGAPALAIRGAEAAASGKDYRLTARIEQTQPGPVYQFDLPLAVTMEGRTRAFQTRVAMDRRRATVTLTVPARPVRLDLDPDFDLFRRLDRSEIPPALSQALGADRALILLPAAAPEALRDAYRRAAEGLRRALAGDVEIGTDAGVRDLPVDRAVWILGWENRLRPEIERALKDFPVSIGGDSFRVGSAEASRARRALVLAGRPADHPDAAIVFAAADEAAAVPGLFRKLPHYGRYGYLIFEGDEPANTAKGEWPVLRSALSVPVAPHDASPIPPAAERAPRRALAPPALSGPRH